MVQEPPRCLLVADDDADDRLLIEEALIESDVERPLSFVEDGVELLDFLLRKGAHATAPRPALILLDLNMPRMDGREALREIRRHPQLRTIPVVILSTSSAEEDIVRCYELGANAFVCKPTRFDDLVELMGRLEAFWFGCCHLPSVNGHG